MSEHDLSARLVESADALKQMMVDPEVAVAWSPALSTIRRTINDAARALAASAQPVPSAGGEREAEEQAAYEIGKRDGRSEAVQQIDERTGGDGEYTYCIGPSDRHCPDPESMIERIVARFDELAALAPFRAAEREAIRREALEEAAKVADFEAKAWGPEVGSSAGHTAYRIRALSPQPSEGAAGGEVREAAIAAVARAIGDRVIPGTDLGLAVDAVFALTRSEGCGHEG